MLFRTAVLLLLASPAFAVDYTKEVKPLLAARCAACHGALAQKAKLRLDTAAFIKQGGRSGSAIVVGKSAESLLIHAVTGHDRERMPPANEGVALSAAQINTLKAWIDAGANAPANEPIPEDPRMHWAFQKPVRPAVPAGAANPIDAFIAEERAKQKLTALPLAERATLLRRVTLDLIGLPPTPSELDAFLKDTSPDAYAKVVDRLLNSPQYGERWARHWMDVWRYADWHGRRMVPDVWNSAPQIWRWRDWIVKSLNTDKGYQRMVAEMLAGDEVAPTDDEAGYATGYLIRNWYALNRNDWMRANVEHVGKAFMGLTFNCAHCHDHKYDPIKHDDYFRLRAFFEPISVRQDRVLGEADPGPFQEYDYSVLRKVQRLGGVRVYDKFPDGPTWFYTAGDERNRVPEKGSIAPGVPSFFKVPIAIQPVQLPREAWNPATRAAHLQALRDELAKALMESERERTLAHQTATTTLPQRRQQLAMAEAAFAELRAKTKDGGALVGQQSVLFDATNGRRLVQRDLKHLKPIKDGVVLRFQVQLLNDAHFNFQLAKDMFKGLTAAYVAWEKGRLLSYKPGTFTEVEVGRYDIAGPKRFTCELTLQPSKDQALLRILAENKVLVDQAPVAINGWQPANDATKGIAFDARQGSIAALDAVQLLDGTTVLAEYDFEAPAYTDGKDLVGQGGWAGSTFSQGTATATVTRVLGNSTLTTAQANARQARLAVEQAERGVAAKEAAVRAQRALQQSLEARIAAEQAPPAQKDELARQASVQHRQAQLLLAEADVLAKELLPDVKARTTANANLAKAKAALTDPKQERVYPPLGPVYPPQSTGRRKALVEWLTHRDHPLTARVAVNHVWLRHFHSPLVATVTDFGRNGAKPTHPALLDWLAVEFIESGWSMKHLHRLMVTSETYQLASGLKSATPLDPENKYYARMNVGRMEAEVVRDSLLAHAGTLDRQMGGQELENSTALTTVRRSLYYSCQPELDGKSPLGTLFDAPEPTDCYRRTRSVLPQQALALTNSDFVHRISSQVAAQLPTTSAKDFVQAAYRLLLSRPPTTAEEGVCVEFLTPTTDATKQRESLIRALLNHNDYIAIR